MCVCDCVRVLLERTMIDIATWGLHVYFLFMLASVITDMHLPMSISHFSPNTDFKFR